MSIIVLLFFKNRTVFCGQTITIAILKIDNLKFIFIILSFYRLNIMGRGTKKKRYLFSILTIIITIFIVLFLFEIILRFLWSGNPRVKSKFKNAFYYPEPSKEISYVMMPNHRYRGLKFSTNEYGFRVPRNIKFNNKDGFFRIVMLGDSIIFGYNTEEKDTISYLLQERLNGSSIKGIKDSQVINLAVCGYNMTQYLGVLNKYGIKYKPDLIIVGVCIYNDFDGYFSTYFDGGILNPIPIFSIRGFNYELKAPSRLIWNLYLLRFLYYKTTKSWSELRLGPRNPINSKYRFIRKRLPASCFKDDPIWDDVGIILDKMKKEASLSPAEILFLIFPSREQLVYAEDVPPVPRNPQKILCNMLSERDLPFIDLFEYFYKYYKVTGNPPYRDQESHPDNAMYELSASLIRDWIARKHSLEPQNRFSGKIEVGREDDHYYLSYGWGKRWKHNLRYRWIQGNSARLIFSKFKDSLHSLEVIAKNNDQCQRQEMSIYVNSKPAGIIDLSGINDFKNFKILLPEALPLQNINILEFSTLCTSNPQDIKYNKIRTREFYSAAVSSISME